MLLQEIFPVAINEQVQRQKMHAEPAPEEQSQLAARQQGPLESNEQRIQARDRRIKEQEAQIHALYESFSWKVTAPLRKIAGFLKGE